MVSVILLAATPIIALVGLLIGCFMRNFDKYMDKVMPTFLGASAVCFMLGIFAMMFEVSNTAVFLP